MPELPEVAALAADIADRTVGQRIDHVAVASLSLLTTYDPPVTDLVGRTVRGVARHGKFLDLVTGGTGAEPDAELHLVIHLALAGWIRWHDAAPVGTPKMGGYIALRVRFSGGGGFDLTEAGTRKAVSASVVTDPGQVPGVAGLGTDALGEGGNGLSIPELAGLLNGSKRRLKTLITDQKVIAGIGNAYSDEILHAAKLSPYAVGGNLDASSVTRLAEAIRSVLLEAVQRTTGHVPAQLKASKRTGMRVHGRGGHPCPTCGDVIASVAVSGRSFEYCPTCQTGGRTLADRRYSKFVR